MSEKICPQCGAPADPDAQFCASCGASLEEAAITEAQVAVASTDTSDAAPADAAPSDAAAASGAVPADTAPADTVPADTAPAPQAYYAQPVPSTQQASGQPVQPGYGNQAQRPMQPTAPVQPGPLSQAWHDLTGQTGWFGTAMVLMLLNLVPILGWYARGYMLEWATQAGDGAQGLPKPRFTRTTLWRGFLYGMLSLLGGIIGLGFTLLFKIPLVGILLYIAWMILVSVFVAMAGVRMTAKDGFGAAFDLSDLWDQFKQAPWGVILAVFVPGLIVGVIMAIIYTAVFASSFYSLGSLLENLAYMGSSASYMGYGMGSVALENLLSMLLGSLTAVGFGAAVAGLVQTALSTIAQLWSLRAVGVWMSRLDPNWRA